MIENDEEIKRLLTEVTKSNIGVQQLLGYMLGLHVVFFILVFFKFF